MIKLQKYFTVLIPFKNHSCMNPNCLVFFLITVLIRPLGSYGNVEVSSCIGLNKAIKRINQGDSVGEIRVSGNTLVNVSACSGLKQIFGNLTIVGLGSPAPKITGDGKHRIFSLESANCSITLKNIIIESGLSKNPKYGGCITIFHNTSFGHFTNVVFRNCSGNFGGAIKTRAPLVLNSVQFLSNFATQSGGAIYASISSFKGVPPLQILNSIFIQNSVSSKSNPAYGGAIFLDNEGTSVIKNSIFSQNKVESSSNYSYGGAIHTLNPLNITNTSFSRNYALAKTKSSYGGAISFNVPFSFDYSSMNSFVSNSTFSENFCFSNTETYGGAISSQSIVHFSSCKFISNYLNSTKASGGAVYQLSGNIQSSNFFNNSINALISFGGAIYIADYVNIYSSIFTKNKVISSGVNAKGGAIYVLDDKFSVLRSYDTQFNANFAYAFGKIKPSKSEEGEAGVNGGAIYSMSDYTSEINNTYINNYVTFAAPDSRVNTHGGAYYGKSTIDTQSSIYINNSAISMGGNAGGGAIAVSNQIYVKSSFFKNNFAISYCKSFCNSYQSGGGAIFSSRSAIISNSNFVGNYHQNFAKNSPSSGGAIFFSALASSANDLFDIVYFQSIQILFCNFQNNTAISPIGTAMGGAVSGFSVQDASLVNGSSFFKNLAKGNISKGGAIYFNDGHLRTLNSVFKKNSALSYAGDASGGALDFSKSTTNNSIHFCTFQSNSAISITKGVAYGGSIYHGKFHPSESFLFPTSSSSSPLRLSCSTFSGNLADGKAGAKGGSIYISDDESIVLARSSFSNSNVSSLSSSFGGSIYAGNRTSLNFCVGNSFASNNYIIIKGKSAKLNILYTNISTQVNFCPAYEKLPIDQGFDSPTTPILKCDVCKKYFSTKIKCP